MTNRASDELLLIVGAPRSGTYLLLTHLGKSLSIAMPVETHFIPLFSRFRFLWGDLGKEKNRSALLAAIYDFLAIWTPRSERGRDYSKVWRFSLLATQSRSEEIVGASNSYGSLVTNLFKEYARLHQSEVCGDKSAFYRHIPLETIEKDIPGLKVIHIVRDGRDVALSWRKLFTGPETISEGARRWAEHVRQKRAWGRQRPKKYLEVKYEDFIQNPADTLAQVRSFLGREDMGESRGYAEMAEMLAAGDMHQKIAGPIDPDNKYRWRQNMSATDAALFEYLAGKELAACGYAVENRDPGARRFLFLLYYICGAKLRFLYSLRYWKLMVKNWLPLPIFLCRKLGFSLASIANALGRMPTPQVERFAE